MKKTLSLLVTLVMVLGILCSCTVSDAAALENADKALEKTPFKVTMSMDFETDNDEASAIFDMMNMEIPIIVDGDNMFLDMSYELYGFTIGMEMTLVGKTLYMKTSAMGVSEKMKAELSDDELSDFLEENGTSMPVDYFEFEEMKSEDEDGKKIITLSGISTKGLDELKGIMNDTLEGTNSSVSIDDISYVITLNDGKYENMKLSCTYSITAEGETFSVTMNANAKYSYENIEKITAPSDASSYKTVDYDSMGE